MNIAVKYYLAAYNFAAFVFWAAYIIAYISGGMQLDLSNLLLLNIAQGLAILEIFHSLFRWVKSPVFSTIAQVSSRLLVVLLLDVFKGAFMLAALFGPIGNIIPVYGKVGVLLISFAWSITELVRYSLYYLTLFNMQPRWLLWMRYSFFIVLYPLGVIGEWLIITVPVTLPGVSFPQYKWALGFLFILYAAGFPMLYGYMWKQRKAKLVVR